MKTFKDFVLTFIDAESLNRFVKRVLEVETPGYKYLEKNTQIDREYSFYNIHSFPAHTISSRIIIGTNQINKTFSIINIVPYMADVHQLECDEYNEILDRFYNNVLSELVRSNSDIKDIVYTSGEYTIEEKMPNSYGLLKTFVDMCNRNSPLAHPNDLNRWYKFICSVVENEENFSSEIIERWLIEYAQFTIEEAGKLADNFIEGRDLLIYYKEHNEYR